MKKLLLLPLLINFSLHATILDNRQDVAGDYYWGMGGVGGYDVGDINKTEYNLSNIMSNELPKTLEEREQSKVNQMRYNQIQTAAFTFGAQAGLANGSKIINKKVEEFNGKDNKLDVVYDFSKLLLEPGLVPPVISEGRDAYNQPSENEVRAADKIYKIEVPAKIVTAPPDWRNYLLLEVTNPEPPMKGILPKTTDEKKIWDEWVQKGWVEGHEQAKDLYDNALSQLNFHFKGMLKYKELYEQGKVTKPKLSRQNLGVTGGGKEMAEGDRIIKKTEDAQLRTNGWYK